jgi:Tol biopolymer transport system component
MKKSAISQFVDETISQFNCQIAKLPKYLLLLIVISGITGQAWGQTENIKPKFLYLLDTLARPAETVAYEFLLCLGDTACNSKKFLAEHVDNIPVLSRKKDKMAYTESSRKLFISDINGDNKVLLYECRSTDRFERKLPILRIQSPVWFYDNSKLLFIKTIFYKVIQQRNLNKQILCIVDLKTNKIDSMEISEDISEIYWAKDNIHLLRRGKMKGSYNKMVSFNLNTGEEKELTDSTMNVLYNEISPERDKIVFCSFPQRQLFTMNVDGTNKKQVTHITYLDNISDGSGPHIPVWSNNGKKIAFIQVIKHEANLVIMNADGSNLKKIDKKILDYKPYQLMWSPNDKWIITRGHEINMISVDGTVVKHLKNASCVTSSFIYMD